MATNKQIDEYFAGQTEPIQGQITDAQNNYAAAREKLNGIADQGRNDLQNSFNRYDKGLIPEMRGNGNHTGMVDSARFGVRNGLGQGYGDIERTRKSINDDLSTAEANTNRTLNAELERYKSLAEAEKLKRRTGRGTPPETPGPANEVGAYDDHVDYYSQGKYGTNPQGIPLRTVADDRYFLGRNASSNYRDIAKEYETTAKAQYEEWRKKEEERAKSMAENNARRSAEARNNSAMWGN